MKAEPSTNSGPDQPQQQRLSEGEANGHPTLDWKSYAALLSSSNPGDLVAAMLSSVNASQNNFIARNPDSTEEAEEPPRRASATEADDADMTMAEELEVGSFLIRRD